VLSGDGSAVTANADGIASITVPPLGAVVWKADRPVSAPDAASAITVSTPVAGAGVTGVTPVVADVDDATWQETSFAWRVAGATGDDAWHALGTAEDTSPRVFHDTAGLAKGTLLEYRAISTDAAGNRAAASTYASVGNAVNLVEREEPEQPIDLVTVPGSHNSEMGCAGDWAPGCEAAKLTLRADGIYSGTFDVAPGDYEYKVAVNGSWDVNYGANGEPNGGNITYSTDGTKPITFYWNPETKVVSSTAEGPVVTLPGSFQQEIGCAATGLPTASPRSCRTATRTASSPGRPTRSPTARTRRRSRTAAAGTRTTASAAHRAGRTTSSPRRRASASSSATRSPRMCSRSS